MGQPIIRIRPKPVIRVKPVPVIVTEEVKIRRHEFPQKPIYVSWTSGVDKREGEAAVEGVRDVLNAVGLDWEIKVFGFQVWGNGDFSSPDWYQEHSMFDPPRNRGFGPQTNAIQVLTYLSYEPYQQQQRHYDVMLVDRDCSTGDANNNFVFGAAWPTLGYVESVARVRPGISMDLRLQLIRRCTCHEFGHVLGLPARNYKVEEKLGRHCTNTACCMRQGLSRDVWIEQLIEEDDAGVLFCQDCLNELHQLR